MRRRHHSRSRRSDACRTTSPEFREVLTRTVPDAVHVLRQHHRPDEGDHRVAAIWVQAMRESGDRLLMVAATNDELDFFMQRLVISIAVAAHREGGVDLFGLHFEAKDGVCSVSPSLPAPAPESEVTWN